MKPFLDSGFLATLLMETSGSEVAWKITRHLETTLLLASFQTFHIENRLQREVESEQSTPREQAMATAALQRFRWYLDQNVFQSIPIDYELAIHLALEWQRRSRKVIPALLLLWPALAVTAGASHFLSFDPRTRALAQAADLALLPLKL
jgi:hypothetical protein